MSEVTNISDLKCDKKNARKRTDRSSKMLQDSLEEIRAARSIVIDENNTILAGNGTVEAAKKVGIKNIQVVETDGETIVAVRRSGLTEDEKTNLALYDNRTSDLADWDVDVLEMLKDSDFDLSKFWNNIELDNLFGILDIEAGAGEKEVDEEIETDNECPKCGYKWS